MDTDDQIAAAAERARDDDTERHHGGDGVEVIERYTDAEWLDCMADLILPQTAEEALVIREQLAMALRWSQRMQACDGMDRAYLAISAALKIGRLIVENAVRNGVTLEKLEHE